MRVILTALFIFGSTVSLGLAASEASSKAQTMRQTGKQILDVGYEQYQRGMYSEAKATLDKAATYREYLSVSDVSKLDELLKKLSTQPSPPAKQPAVQSTAAELLSQARSLAAKGQFAQAKEKYIQAEQSGQLSNDELSAVEAELTALEQTQASQSAKPVINQEPVIGQKVEPVVAEQPKPAQQPGVNSQYIEYVPIDTNNVNRPQYVTPAAPSEANFAVIETNKVNQQPIQPKAQAAPTPQEQEKESYIEVVKQKQRIQQSYTKAIVNDAVAKAKEYADKENFTAARDEISRAAAVVEKNKMLLGEDDYKQYKDTLQQLSNEISTRQAEIEKQKAEKAKTEAKASQENLRAQQAADKNKRIQDLLTHSAEYQEQQRYEEALAEINTLLAIDPINREGLRNKQMLEDIINLRTQLEIKHEIGQQEEAVLTDTQRSMIPHADLITYPRNWQDIVAKRKPSIISDLSPADTAVTKELETPVDLSALTPDTPLSEAIKTIQTSVDPPLKIVVHWKDLADNAYIEQDTAIGMQGMSGIPVGKALKELLNTVSGGGVANISYAVEDGIITIATKASLPDNLVRKVYNITDLVGTPSNAQTPLNISTSGVSGGGGSSSTGSGQGGGLSRAMNIIQMIQQTVTPESWDISGGAGTITPVGGQGTNDNIIRLIISQTPQIHELIQKLLDDLRKSGQVSIEARFLFVTENFLEDIGFGINTIQVGPRGKLGQMTFSFNSAGNTAPNPTSIEGSFGSSSLTPLTQAVNLSNIGGVQYNLLDDLQVSFFLNAVQAHRDAKTLTAPRVTVRSGEQAYISVTKDTAYISNYTFTDITTGTTVGGTPIVRTVASPTTTLAGGGVVLNVTPIISDDKKYVILDIHTNYTKATLAASFVFGTSTTQEYPISLPTFEASQIETRVNVPDQGTLLIGGQKLGAEINLESGVPGLSKVPIIGRLFDSRSKVKDQEVLLILVKPSIILQEEKEREFLAPLEE
jgi:type II secretory pathway component GspD/PulD (secretin)